MFTVKKQVIHNLCISFTVSFMKACFHYKSSWKYLCKQNT